ncbi:MAG TPA: flavin prenyltransferase UbiX [Longimicrobiales bacterium]|nr:flavin prenyltransferase UbiX [Longimicrobiales bacterium]
MTHVPITVAMTGASGAPYAVRLLEILNREGVPVSLIISDTGWRLLDEELDIKNEEQLRSKTGDWSNVKLFADNDRGATPASGSAPSRGMVVCPCSMGTLASIAQGTTRSLIERAADVCLKERHRLILVPRETPYSSIHLENMLRVTQAGAVVLPASPAFYHKPKDMSDLIDFIVGRILMHLKVDVNIGPRWQSGE